MDCFQFLGQSEASNTISDVFMAVGNFVGGVFGVFAILVMTFYMVVKEDNIEKLVRLASPERYHTFLNKLLRNISKKAWYLVAKSAHAWCDSWCDGLYSFEDYWS